MTLDSTAQEGQSFFDIALQGGSIETVFLVAENASITDTPEIGRRYKVPVLDKAISNYYQKQALQPATAITTAQIILIENEGIGRMTVGTTFIVSP